MNFIDSSICLENCMLASSSVYRRQLFLIRSLGGYCCRVHMEGGGRAMSSSLSTLGADAEGVMRKITPKLDPTLYKGQAGKVAVIGGCREYTGAPYFAAISALKIGADLSHVFCTKDAAAVIKCYSPELIVHPILEESYSVRDDEKATVSAKVLGEVKKWMERFDCIVVGPGLGRDPFLLNCVGDIIRQARDAKIPTVIDGDGLFLVTNNLDLVKGNSLAILTPNVNEYKRLVEKVLQCQVNDEDAYEQLSSLARSVAVFSSWARHHLSTKNNESRMQSSLNPMVLGGISGSALLRKAASLAFENKKRSTLTSDIIECLGKSLEDICPAF